MRVAIIDDQQNFLNLYKQKLKNIENLDIETFTSIYDFEKSNQNIDFILLDIDMPDCDGIAYAKLHQDDRIVFLTSQGHRIKDAFGTNIYGFIEKSDSDEYLVNKVKEVMQLIKNESFMRFKINDYYINFKKKDIVYAQYISYKTIGFVYHNTQYLIKGYTLKEFKNFMQDIMIYCDRDTLINQYKILDIIGDVVYLEGIRQHFKISRRRLKEFQSFG